VWTFWGSGRRPRRARAIGACLTEYNRRASASLGSLLLFTLRFLRRPGNDPRSPVGDEWSRQGDLPVSWTHEIKIDRVAWVWHSGNCVAPAEIETACPLFGFRPSKIGRDSKIETAWPNKPYLGCGWVPDVWFVYTTQWGCDGCLTTAAAVPIVLPRGVSESLCLGFGVLTP
jgi:hypothetical protein